jgi:predicted P-loop ATPase
MWKGGNYNIDFMINKNFIQVVDKLKDKLQVQVINTCWVLSYAIMESHNCKKSRMHKMVQTN